MKHPAVVLANGAGPLAGIQSVWLAAGLNVDGDITAASFMGLDFEGGAGDGNHLLAAIAIMIGQVMYQGVLAGADAKELDGVWRFLHEKACQHMDAAFAGDANATVLVRRPVP